jgi:hypothetical protein
MIGSAPVTPGGEVAATICTAAMLSGLTSRCDAKMWSMSSPAVFASRSMGSTEGADDDRTTSPPVGRPVRDRGRCGRRRDTDVLAGISALGAD